MNKRQKKELTKSRRKWNKENRAANKRDFLISCSCHIAGSFIDVIYAMKVCGPTKQDYLRWITYSTADMLEDDHWNTMSMILDRIEDKKRRKT